MNGLSEGNTNNGYIKSRPLTGNAYRREQVEARHILCAPSPASTQTAESLAWWRLFLVSMDRNLLLDRHFLSDVERHVCIDETIELWEQPQDCPGEALIENLRLDFARRFDSALNFRNLPVSLLRLYFSGQKRFRRLCRRHLVTERAHRLRLIMDRDSPSPPQSNLLLLPLPSDDIIGGEEEKEEDLYLSHSEKLQLERFQQYLKTVLNVCLCSFETCLSRVLETLQSTATTSSDCIKENERWHEFNLFQSLANDEYWQNFPIPEGVRYLIHFYEQRPSREIFNRCLLLSNSLIWLVCVWRINSTLLIEQLLMPWETTRGQEWLQYQMRLFRDTHLDLLTQIVKYDLYDDSLLSQEILHEYYPSAQRVCCADELPDFIKYTADNFKTGAGLKERASLEDQIGHLLINKTGNNICKVRNLETIFLRDGEANNVIYDIIMNLSLCVLLGNLKGSRGSLDMMARLRVNYSFSREERDAVISEADYVEATKNKAVKKTVSPKKKKKNDELIFTKTNFKLWLVLVRHFVLYLFKEFLFYIAESSLCFDDLLSETFKYQQYKTIVPFGNGRCRNILSRQAKRLALDEEFQWHEIEYEDKQAGRYDYTCGEIKKFHRWALKSHVKVMKDDFIKILCKKMTSAEKHFSFSHRITTFQFMLDDQSQQQATVLINNNKITEDELLEIAFYMARDRSPIVQTRWFQALGMSRRGLEQLRDWLFEYYTRNVADDSYKEKIIEFQKRSMDDYILLKTVFKLILYYREMYDHFLLPISIAKKQTMALRHLMRVEEWERTPVELGVSHQCQGCFKFACNVVNPVQYIENNDQYTVAQAYVAVTRTNQEKAEREMAPRTPGNALALLTKSTTVASGGGEETKQAKEE